MGDMEQRRQTDSGAVRHHAFTPWLQLLPSLLLVVVLLLPLLPATQRSAAHAPSCLVDSALAPGIPSCLGHTPAVLRGPPLLTADESLRHAAAALHRRHCSGGCSSVVGGQTRAGRRAGGCVGHERRA